MTSQTPEPALLLGAGGHARVLISLLRTGGRYAPRGILDIAGPGNGSERIMEVPVLGGLERLEELTREPAMNLFLAVGDNRTREALYARCRGLGRRLPTLVGPGALVDPTATLGEANVVCAGAFVGPMARIGDNNILNTRSLLEHEAVLGSHCHLAPGSVVAGRSRLGDRVFLGASATVIDRIAVAGDTTIGAGAVVVVPIEAPGGTHVGVPARRLP